MGVVARPASASARQVEDAFRPGIRAAARGADVGLALCGNDRSEGLGPAGGTAQEKGRRRRPAPRRRFMPTAGQQQASDHETERGRRRPGPEQRASYRSVTSCTPAGTGTARFFPLARSTTVFCPSRAARQPAAKLSRSTRSPARGCLDPVAPLRRLPLHEPHVAVGAVRASLLLEGDVAGRIEIRLERPRRRLLPRSAVRTRQARIGERRGARQFVHSGRQARRPRGTDRRARRRSGCSRGSRLNTRLTAAWRIQGTSRATLPAGSRPLAAPAGGE